MAPEVTSYQTMTLLKQASAGIFVSGYGVRKLTCRLEKQEEEEEEAMLVTRRRI